MHIRTPTRLQEPIFFFFIGMLPVSHKAVNVFVQHAITALLPLPPSLHFSPLPDPTKVKRDARHTLSLTLDPNIYIHKTQPASVDVPINMTHVMWLSQAGRVTVTA